MDYLEHALVTGAIPNPIDGEAVDSYRLRVAHAGAIVGAKWLSERNAALAEEENVVPLGDTEPVPSEV
jgi:hypothetical protein